MSALGALAKVAKAKPLRSTLDEAVEALARPKGTGAEYLKELEKTKGVKPTEIKERGIDKVLADLPKVNKEEIVKAIQSKANPTIEQKMLGADTHKELSKNEQKYLKELEEDYKADDLNPFMYNDYLDLKNRAEKSTELELHRASERIYEQMLSAKDNGQKRLADELSRQMDILNDRQQRIGKVLQNPTKYEEYTLPSGQNYREILLRLPNKKGEQFQSGHFDEPNILAHMRVSDRAGPNGEKVLHLEELQSDWHQKGRDKGYKSNLSEDDIRKAYNAQEHNAVAFDDLRPEDRAYEIEKYRESGVPDAPFKKNWHEVALKKLINYATENGYNKIAITPGAEQAKRYDLSKQVDELLYKQNPDGTYQLSAQVQGRGNLLGESIHPEKLQDYVGKDIAEKIVSGEGKSREIQGKYNPESMTSSKDYMQSLSKIDLQVGGEGMKGFYDKILPDYLNKLGKPHGAEVKMNDMRVSNRDPEDRSWPANTPHPFVISSDINEPFEGMVDLMQRHPVTGVESLVGRMPRAQANEHIAKELQNLDTINQTHLHTFDLTPSLKNEVTQKGLPLYQQIGIPLGGAEAVNQAQPEPEMRRGGKVVVSNNPDAMFMELHDKKFAGGGLVRKIAEKLGTKMIPAVEAEANKAKFLEPSKVKDRLYHGTNNDIVQFDPNKAGKKTGNLTSALGTFLSDNPEESSRYAELWGTEGGNVMPVFAQLKNPYVMPYAEYNNLAMGAWNRRMKDPDYDPNRIVKSDDIEGQKRSAEALKRHEAEGLKDVIKRRNELIEQGHDSIIMNIGGNREIVAFDPKQIKSAIGNQGTYDVTKPEITKKTGGAVQSLETNLPALPKTDYHSIDELMAHISKEHKIAPQKLHDDFVAKHHMTPDTWIKRK